MKIDTAFAPHDMPPGALPVRCHVLQAGKARLMEDFLVQELPWCYTTKGHIKKRIEEAKVSPTEILANKLPDPGSVMSGDFGEILTLFFLSSERTEATTPIKKWRYKQDRQKPAPHSDVILLYREKGDKPTKRDFVICAEAKQKSTNSTFNPIKEAVDGFEKDRTGRLARTLVWLKEKALDQESRENLEFVKRFTDDLSVEYLKHFKAVAVVDRALLDEEITQHISLPEQDSSFEVVVLGINELKTFYERVFARSPSEVTIE